MGNWKQSFFAIVMVLGSFIVTLDAQQQPQKPQQVTGNNVPSAPGTSDTHNNMKLMIPEYAEVFYHRTENGELVALPHKTPKDISKFKASLSLGKDVEARKETPTPTFVVQVDGNKDPSQKVLLTPVQDGKIPLGKDSESSFSKVVKVKVTPLGPGNRVFEVKPVDQLSSGVYALAIKNDNPFSIPECYIFRVE
jgi:hypothetical protein